MEAQEEPLEDEEILIGKGVDHPAADEKPVRITTISKAFSNNCPLWIYVLAEAMKKQEAVRIPVKENVSITTPKLGQVGGRIVAEVFLGLMFGDNHSLLSLAPNWYPEGSPNYALKDFVKYALGMKTETKVRKHSV